MRFSWLLLIFFQLFYSCRENTNRKELEENDNKNDALIPENIAAGDASPEPPLSNWELLDTANRENIFEDTVPAFLEDFARKNEFPCPDTMTGCAACGYCAYIRLSKDWSYFAYERQETKHYCQLRIYTRTRSGIIALDTLYGTVINALPVKGSLVYQITMLEDYWADERPMNVEFYRYEKGRFVLTDSIPGKW